MSKTVKQVLKDNGIVGTMPKKVKAKWLAALRSGDYKQTTGTLCDPADRVGDNPAFCCLGVLEHCLTGGVEEDSSGTFETMPTPAFMEDWGINFINEQGDKAGEPTLVLQNQLHSASELNDDGMSFKQIANLIDKQVEGV